MDKQQQAIDLIKRGENIFLTGPGGVGKSWVVEQVKTPFTLVAAPTGIAALNVGGTTCHKMFGLPLGIPTEDDFKKVSSKVRDRFECPIDTIIIDEISMLRADHLALIDHRLRKIRKSEQLFGGIQMVVVGDFFQLEPIVGNNDREHFYTMYSSPFCFTSDSWNFKTVELTEVIRQDDARQVRMLNSIRRGDDRSNKALRLINKESEPYVNTASTLHLCCYNGDADKVNQHWYGQIKSPSKHYSAKWSGNWNDREIPVHKKVELKVGARVIICANCVGETYSNGDRGVVKEMLHKAVNVELDGGGVVRVEEFTWEKTAYNNVGGKLSKDVEASFTQIPIKLGWAVSVHKSQGMTLDQVSLDIGNGCFSHGQLYVALSRVKDLRKLSLKTPLRPSDLIVKQEVKDFYERGT